MSAELLQCLFFSGLQEGKQGWGGGGRWLLHIMLILSGLNKREREGRHTRLSACLELGLKGEEKGPLSAFRYSPRLTSLPFVSASLSYTLRKMMYMVVCVHVYRSVK